MTLRNSCKIFARDVFFLQNFCKICVFFAKFLQKLYSVWTNLFHNVFVIALKESDTYVPKFRVFLNKNVRGILQSIQNQDFRVGSEKRQEWFYPKGRDKEKNCFILYLYSDKLSHYKRYDFRKFLIPDASKHIRLQNTLNRCKVYQILRLTVDYACFLVKCINYQNVMCLKIIYFLQDLARLLQKLHYLQETQLLQNFCKNWVIVARFLQEFCKIYFQIHQSCKICIFTRILQKLYWLQEFGKSCIHCKNFARFLQKLFFFWTWENL